ncbi:hypothetical protein TNIN_265941 [Trichonephila inaurata madagascariensis]|uniref:Uncharacterized protein n=1 Tax=Trichonephila inaurata madagascariensis TaxID=2747483 RepID=A0A8X6YG91_9ARAC|nr:hypothetical protein TNIN_265941 [Trichonephila inaurata madagascariensis]
MHFINIPRHVSIPRLQTKKGTRFRQAIFTNEIIVKFTSALTTYSTLQTSSKTAKCAEWTCQWMGKNITILLRKTSARVVWEDFATLIKKKLGIAVHNTCRGTYKRPRALKRDCNSIVPWICYNVRQTVVINGVSLLNRPQRCLKRAVCSGTMIKVLG